MLDNFTIYILFNLHSYLMKSVLLSIFYIRGNLALGKSDDFLVSRRTGIKAWFLTSESCISITLCCFVLYLSFITRTVQSWGPVDFCRAVLFSYIVI